MEMLLLIDFLDEAATAATIVAGLAAATALVYAGYQVKLAKNVASAQMMLHIDELMNSYDDIQDKLEFGTLEAADWTRVSRYMGLLERVKVLASVGLLEIETVDRLYGFRVRELMNHPTVQGLLSSEKGRMDWQDFIELANMLDRVSRQRRAHGGLK